ncbi:hypothetical protein JGI3_01690 [Candidatus Kryptobacter tengchongensis]|nr:hypothetical protein JGI2_01434 [Candidatus Kryptobacter tengchongensis]CUU08415.1 hypothetical protein JGI3_01690 [Candidatus Kryptobacter tengchongensis]
MLYLTSYKEGDKFYCSIKFSGDGIEVRNWANSFWKALIGCFIRGLIFELELKIKKTFGKWKER